MPDVNGARGPKCHLTGHGTRDKGIVSLAEGSGVGTDTAGR